MANINASALNSLQTRINAERSRRSLSPVTFTDGTLSAGGTIKATHFNELRSYTEGLNTLGSQTFNWSGNIAVGASITDVITQINNFVTTLEGEVLASWKTLSASSVNVGGALGGENWWTKYIIPTNARDTNKIRYKHNETIGSDCGTGVYGYGQTEVFLMPDNLVTASHFNVNTQIFNYWSYNEGFLNPQWTGTREFDTGLSGVGWHNNGSYSQTDEGHKTALASSMRTDPYIVCNSKSGSYPASKGTHMLWHSWAKITQRNVWNYGGNNSNLAPNLVFMGRDQLGTMFRNNPTGNITVEAYY